MALSADRYAKIELSPETRDAVDEITLALVEAGLLDAAQPREKLEADTFEDVLRASSAVPLRFRWRAVVASPVRVLRVQRALRPSGERIRTRLPLPRHNNPWLEEDEVMRRILRGF